MASLRPEPGPLYSVYFAPRGYVRMTQMGMQIAQRHLHTFDRLIGIIGDAGSGRRDATSALHADAGGPQRQHAAHLIVADHKALIHAHAGLGQYLFRL